MYWIWSHGVNLFSSLQIVVPKGEPCQDVWKLGFGADLPREEALKVIQEEGILLILSSLIEGTNYVVAEAAILQIPFLVSQVYVNSLL